MQSPMKHRNAFKADVPVWKRGENGYAPETFPSRFPNVRKVSYETLAFRLLGQPSSSSCAKRNWSSYAFIHSLRRNKLTTSRAQDLVYIHNNLRLLSRNPNDDVKMWDVGGDAFDSMEDVGFLEFSDPH
ncbi:hAT dimerization domain, ribonuclease H-like domain protein [Tanacetum coccineum]